MTIGEIASGWEILAELLIVAAKGWSSEGFKLRLAGCFSGEREKKKVEYEDVLGKDEIRNSLRKQINTQMEIIVLVRSSSMEKEGRSHSNLAPSCVAETTADSLPH